MIAGMRLQSTCPYSIFLMAASFCDAIKSVRIYLYTIENMNSYLFAWPKRSPWCIPARRARG